MKNIPIDELIRSKRKSVSLTITKDAQLVVRAPLRLPLREIEKMIVEKKDWIINKQNLAAKRLEQAVSFTVEEGGRFLFLGQPLTLVIRDNIKGVAIEGKTLLLPNGTGKAAAILIKKWYQKQARLILPKRLSEISNQLRIPYQKCSVTSARKRWGSCSSLNHINLNWRLIMADPRAIDYVIVHELCHVIHKNHSKNFWNKVREIMPDYTNMRKWLKENAYILDIIE